MLLHLFLLTSAMADTQISLAALLWGIMTAVVVLAYFAGRQSMRLDKLEEWRNEFRDDFQEFKSEMRDHIPLTGPRHRV